MAYHHSEGEGDVPPPVLCCLRGVGDREAREAMASSSG